MANRWFRKGKEAVADGSIVWTTHDMRVVLLSAAYVVNLDIHDNLDDIAAGARIATSANLSGKSVTNGIYDAADPVFPSVSGAQITQVVTYRWTGVESTSRLLFYADYADGLPFTPVGTDVTLEFDNGANKIAAI